MSMMGRKVRKKVDLCDLKNENMIYKLLKYKRTLTMMTRPFKRHTHSDTLSPKKVVARLLNSTVSFRIFWSLEDASDDGVNWKTALTD